MEIFLNKKIPLLVLLALCASAALFAVPQKALAISCGTGSNIAFSVVGSRCQGFITATGQSTFTVPSNWNSSNNSVAVIGGGAGGAAGCSFGAGAVIGGGAGAYASSSNLSFSPLASVTVIVGTGGNGGVGECASSQSGADTLFNRTAGSANTCADTVTVCANGGNSNSSGGQTAGNASKGTTLFVGGSGFSLGGGGGAGGMNGAGVDAAGIVGGNGGNGHGGSGGAANTAGNPGTEFDGTHGSGGGGGGSNSTSIQAGAGGNYGAGGGGGDGSGLGDGVQSNGGNGKQGLIIITYTPTAGGSHTAINKPGNNLGLIGYWPMNEGSGIRVNDNSPFGNFGTTTNNPTWVNGRMGKALQFNGTSNYVTAGNIPQMNTLSQITVSAWVKASSPNANAGRESHIVDKSDCHGDPTSGTFEFLNGDLDRADFAVYANGGSPSESTCKTGLGESLPVCQNFATSTYDDGNWHFITGTWDGNTVTSWADGIALGARYSLGGPYTLSATSTPFEVGGYCNGNGPGAGNIYSGTIDEVRVYNRALSTSSIQTLYKAGAARITAPTSVFEGTKFGGTNGLVGHWTFDGPDITATRALDKSGSGNDGFYFRGAATSAAKVIGKLGQALNFTSVTNNMYIEVDGIKTALQTSDLTFAAWVKFPSTYTAASNPAELMRFGDSNSNNDVALSFGRVDNNVLSGELTFGAVQIGPVQWDVSVSPQNIWKANTWYFVAGTLSGASTNMVLTTYVNGLPVDSNTTGALRNNSADATYFWIGGEDAVKESTDAFMPIEPFLGTIDDPRVYNRALSAAEILQLYNLGTVHLNH